MISSIQPTRPHCQYGFTPTLAISMFVGINTLWKISTGTGKCIDILQLTFSFLYGYMSRGHPSMLRHKSPEVDSLAQDDVIKWKHFPRYWPFVRGIHRSPVNSPHKGQWRGALMFSLICTRINGWVNNGEAGDLRRKRAHYDVTLMGFTLLAINLQCYRSRAHLARGWGY